MGDWMYRVVRVTLHQLVLYVFRFLTVRCCLFVSGGTAAHFAADQADIFDEHFRTSCASCRVSCTTCVGDDSRCSGTQRPTTTELQLGAAAPAATWSVGPSDVALVYEDKRCQCALSIRQHYDASTAERPPAAVACDVAGAFSRSQFDAPRVRNESSNSLNN